MENKAQTTPVTKERREIREPGDSQREAYASQVSPREDRVSEPRVETDGQLAEAGYGHGV